MSLDDSPGLATDIQVQATYRLTEALVEAENQMRRRVQLLSDVVFETDTSGRIVFLNDAWARAVGEPPAECLRRNLNDFVHDDDRRHVSAALAAIGTTDAERVPPIRLLRVDGGYTWVEISVAALPAGGAVGVLHDITERKLAQDELAKLSLVASYTDNLVIITDHEGITEWVNQAFVRKTGYAIDDLTGRRPGHILQGPDTDATEVARIGALVRAGHSFEAELLNYTKGGAPYWVRMQVNPIRDEHGAIVQFVSVQEVTTELHRANSELATAKERAEAANDAKTRFLATVSHEMRTPLNAILGSTDLALDGEYDPATLHAHLRRIKVSSESLLRLISDILDVSKIEAGQFDIERIAVDLHACVHDALAPTGEKARAKGLGFTFSWDGSLPRSVMCDPGRLQQIVSNLSENAVRFTDHGHVSVGVSPRVPTADDPSTVEIRVVDTGVGISAEAQERIFERFEQGDSSLTRRKGGAGLGLNIVRSLVEVFHGSVGVHSTPGEGSEFWVRLPLPAVATAPRSSASDSRTQREVRADGSRRVLVAEDDDLNYTVVKAFLTRAGYSVTRAADGNQAVAAAPDADLVLMDIEMPVMDGLEATRRIRERESTAGERSTPVIALTAHAVEDFRERCFAAGASGFLTKPIRLHTLLEAVESAFATAEPS